MNSSSAFLTGRGVRCLRQYGVPNQHMTFSSVVEESENQKKDEEKNEDEDEYSNTAT